MEKNLKITSEIKSFVDKETKEEIKYTQYYIVAGNVRIAIKAAYKGDKAALALLAE